MVALERLTPLGEWRGLRIRQRELPVWTLAPSLLGFHWSANPPRQRFLSILLIASMPVGKIETSTDKVLQNKSLLNE